MGTAVVVWRKNRIPAKRQPPRPTICSLILQLYADAEDRGDAVSMQRLDECHDMAKRMDARLRFYKAQFRD